MASIGDEGFCALAFQKERGVIERPDIASYSVPARICLGIAVFGVLLFAVMAGIYFVR